MVASADYLNDKWTNLVKEKQELISELEKCQKNTKGFKIAGLATLGVSAIGIGVNIGEAVKINSLEDEVDAVKKRVEKLDTEINKAKNTCGTENCAGKQKKANAAEHICINDEWKVLKCAETYNEQDEDECKRNGEVIKYYDKCIKVNNNSVSMKYSLNPELMRNNCVQTPGGCDGVPKPQNLEDYNDESKFVCFNKQWLYNGNCAQGYFPTQKRKCDGVEYIISCGNNEGTAFEDYGAYTLNNDVFLASDGGGEVKGNIGGIKASTDVVGPCQSKSASFNAVLDWTTLNGGVFPEFPHSYRYSSHGNYKKFADILTKFDTSDTPYSNWRYYLAVRKDKASQDPVLVGCGEERFFVVNNITLLTTGLDYNTLNKNGFGSYCQQTCGGVQFDYEFKKRKHKACIRDENALLDACEKYCNDIKVPRNERGFDRSECTVDVIAVDRNNQCHCDPLVQKEYGEDGFFIYRRILNKSIKVLDQMPIEQTPNSK